MKRREKKRKNKKKSKGSRDGRTDLKGNKQRRRVKKETVNKEIKIEE